MIIPFTATIWRLMEATCTSEPLRSLCGTLSSSCLRTMRMRRELGARLGMSCWNSEYGRIAEYTSGVAVEFGHLPRGRLRHRGIIITTTVATTGTTHFRDSCRRQYSFSRVAR
jgi:hypothetical protein